MNFILNVLIIMSTTTIVILEESGSLEMLPLVSPLEKTLEKNLKISKFL